MNTDKLYNLASLKIILEKERKKDKSIAVANGCFDLIHVGHIRFLKEAKKRADILVVALNSDRSIKKLKGNNRAILKEADRVKIIAAFAFVDYLVLFEETTANTVLLNLKPHFHCKGSDYASPSLVPEYNTVKSYGGKTLLVGGEKIHSTSNIINKIKSL